MKFLVPENYQGPVMALKCWGFCGKYSTRDGLIIGGKHLIKKPSLNDLEYEASKHGVSRIKLPPGFNSPKTLSEYLKIHKIYDLEKNHES